MPAETQLHFDLTEGETTLTDQGTKKCSECGQVKPLSDFGKASKAKDGLFWICKGCSRAKGLEKNARNIAKNETSPPSLEGTKCCQICQQDKPKTEFNRSNSTTDGFFYCCRECDKARCKETAAKNRKKNKLNPPSLEGTKYCKGCGEWKPKTKFNRNNSSKDGFHHRCKACKKEIDEAREVVNAEARALKPAPSDAMKKCTMCGQEKPLREFFNCKKNKDGKHFRCKTCMRKLDDQYYDDNHERRWAIATLNMHRRRGFEVVIATHELEAMAKATRQCPICGCDLDWNRKEDRRLRRNSPTLDRKNNERKMSIDSVCILCHRCNSMKGDLNVSELLKWCNRVKLWAGSFGG